jgi:hypothetical protein
MVNVSKQGCWADSFENSGLMLPCAAIVSGMGEDEADEYGSVEEINEEAESENGNWAALGERFLVEDFEEQNEPYPLTPSTDEDNSDSDDGLAPAPANKRLRRAEVH